MTGYIFNYIFQDEEYSTYLQRHQIAPTVSGSISSVSEDKPGDDNRNFQNDCTTFHETFTRRNRSRKFRFSKRAEMIAMTLKCTCTIYMHGNYIFLILKLDYWSRSRDRPRVSHPIVVDGLYNCLLGQ